MFSIHQRSSFLAKFPIITTPGNFPDCSDLIFATVGGKKLNFPGNIAWIVDESVGLIYQIYEKPQILQQKKSMYLSSL